MCVGVSVGVEWVGENCGSELVGVSICRESDGIGELCSCRKPRMDVGGLLVSHDCWDSIVVERTSGVLNRKATGSSKSAESMMLMK